MKFIWDETKNKSNQQKHGIWQPVLALHVRGRLMLSMHTMKIGSHWKVLPRQQCARQSERSGPH